VEFFSQKPLFFKSDLKGSRNSKITSFVEPVQLFGKRLHSNGKKSEIFSEENCRVTGGVFET